MSDVTIRPSTPHDLPAIQALLPKQRLDVLCWMLGGSDSDYPLHSFVATVDDAIASHPAFLKALRHAGYVTRDGTPIWVRDPCGLLPRTPWHVTGLEGDVGYRHL